MTDELRTNGHCETLVVDDEPTEGASGDAQAELCARAPVGLLAELTHRCPLQCSYCSNPIELERVNKELSTEMWCSVMKQAGEMGILQVHLSGGEPTARKDLEDIVSAASDAGLYSNLITAAVTLNRPRLEDLAKRGLDHVQISFQDVDAENAERIGAYPGATAKKLDVARWVTELGLPLTVNAPIHRQNIHNVGRYIELAIKLGAQRLEIAHVQYYGWAYLNRAALIPTYDQTIESIELVERERERLKGVLTIDMVVPDYYAKRPKPCMGGWGKGFMNITPAGKVLPVSRGRDHQDADLRQRAGAPAARHLAQLRCVQRLPRHRLDEGAVPLVRLQGHRLRRLPLPGHGDHRRCPQHRPGLRAVALSRRDGAPRPRGSGQAADAVRLSQSAQCRRGREGSASARSRRVALNPRLSPLQLYAARATGGVLRRRATGQHAIGVSHRQRRNRDRHQQADHQSDQAEQVDQHQHEREAEQGPFVAVGNATALLHRLDRTELRGRSR